MRVNKTLIIVLLLGFMGFFLLFTFDPTHNFPSTEVDVNLLPGEEITINVPKTGALQWALTIMSNPWLWAETTADGVIVKVGDRVRPLVPSEILGLLPSGGNSLTVQNINNLTFSGRIKAVCAPPPSEIGNLKAAWWMIYGTFMLGVSTIISYIKPAPTINIQSPIRGSLASRTNAGPLRDAKCAKCRTGCTMCLRAGCLRHIV
jgi:hypothetical protein